MSESRDVRTYGLPNDYRTRIHRLINEGKLPNNLVDAERMGTAIGMALGKKKRAELDRAGFEEWMKIDPTGLLLRLAPAKELCQFADAGIEILLNELESGKSYEEIYQDIAKALPSEKASK